MFKTDHDRDEAESVSPIALEIINALRMKLIECLLVLQMLPTEADLNFDELTDELVTAHRGVQKASEAASLVHQGAELEERWGINLSRPRAIFARHDAAVRTCGARRVRPIPGLCDQIERRLWQLPIPDCAHDVPSIRPKCSKVVGATGEDCTNVAIYLGSGMHGAHCYMHSTRGERDHYRIHQNTVNEHQSQSRRELLVLQRSIGQSIAAQWIAQRAQHPEWVDSLVPQ